MRIEDFQLKPTIVTSINEAIRLLGGDIFADEFDLVLVDFDLGQGTRGDDGLRQIRTRVAYKEIIFYSSKPATDLRELAYKQRVEGVYCSSRDDLVETAIGVFDTLIKKVLDLDHVRGIVMGATSDIENTVHDVLLALFETQNEQGQAKIRRAALKKIDEKLARLSAAGEGAKGDVTIEELFGLHELLTAADKLKLLIHELKGRTDDGVKPMRIMLSTYLENVMSKRNIVAHVRMQITEGGLRILRSSDGKELTQEQLRTMRHDLIDHRLNFSALAGFLAKRHP
jgi:hypothetical protein